MCRRICPSLLFHTSKFLRHGLKREKTLSVTFMELSLNKQSVVSMSTKLCDGELTFLHSLGVQTEELAQECAWPE